MDTNTLTLLASFFLPLLVDLIIGIFKIDSTLAMKLVAGVLSFLIALIPEISNNLPITDPKVFITNIVSKFAVVFTISQTVYSNILKNTKLSKTLAGK